MKQSIKIALLTGGVAFTPFITSDSVGQSNHRYPNVVYVFPDQYRNSALGFWNESDFRQAVNFDADPVVTPNLNRFAHESIVLTSAMSNCPLSSPHRGSLLTGMFPENSGVPLNCNSDRIVSSLSKETECISDVFSKAGYNCAYIGKLHVDCPTPNDPDSPGNYVESRTPAWDAYTPPEKRHGFDYWYSYGTYDVHKHPHYWDTKGKKHEINQWSPIHEAEKAVEYIRNQGEVRDVEKPFFMMVSFNPPHNPYASLDDCLEEDYEHYRNKTIDELLVRPNADKSMKKAAEAPFYFSSVTGVDRAFGMIVEELKRQGLDKNTIIVFSSDHGETMCSQGTADPKNSPYSESMNVPFMIKFPDNLKPRIEQDLILSSPDIMPTLLGLAGLGENIPKTVEGRDYSAYLNDGTNKESLRKGALYIKNADGDKDSSGKVISYFPISRGIKTHQYTLAITISRKGNKLSNILLFDDVNDPYQMHPLDPVANSEVLNDLYSQMAILLKEAKDPWWKQKILGDIIPYQL